MKLVSAVLFCGIFAASVGFAQDGAIFFGNSSNSKISNAFTRAFVVGADGINVMLYAAPAGTTNEDEFIPLPPSTNVGSIAIFPGRFPGSIRIGIGFPGPSTNAFTNSIQLRAFETNYGSTYEQALVAPPMNGRPALVGKSAITQVALADAYHAIYGDCGPFSVDIAGNAERFLTVNDLVVAEGSNGTAVANFKVSLATIQSQTVTVDFTTTDGTALAGSDYIATNGTVTFLPGETLKIVPVTLTPDGPAEPDEEFYLDLSNAVNGALAKTRGTCVITDIRISGISVDTSISFNTVSTRRYVVERTSDFITWQPVAGATNVGGTGGTVTVVDRGYGCASSVIYRARLIDP